MLKVEMEKSQKTLTAAQSLDLTDEGEGPEEVRKAQLRVEALGIAVQAAHHDIGVLISLLFTVNVNSTC